VNEHEFWQKDQIQCCPGFRISTYSFNADPDPAFFLIEDPGPAVFLIAVPDLELDPGLFCEFKRIRGLLK
jgi:hypothetical protein